MRKYALRNKNLKYEKTKKKRTLALNSLYHKYDFYLTMLLIELSKKKFHL